ncbi:carbohydrate-binding protein [Archangium violaceum]|uniref:carbohydrate-binding protein n=1 Tax=Archangium violaceum TaxID=83451 RepID=UPI002B2EA456|nr:carbohydrate-binding protein [Archangium gephyra]
MVNGTDSFPRANTHWFRDWFYPLYKNHGGAQVLNRYFVLLAQYLPKNGGDYARNLTSVRVASGYKITFPATGSYKIEYRVASQSGGGKLSLDLNAGATVLGTVDIPSTGGWQNWTTVTHTVSVTAGTYNVGIYAQAGGWNFNWFRITRL